jgi:hypothetical protein
MNTSEVLVFTNVLNFEPIFEQNVLTFSVAIRDVYSGSGFSIPDPGSRIPDPTTTKSEGKK